MKSMKWRVAMGLDRPLPLQFLSYMGEVLSGDLGRLVSTNREVISDLARVFPATLEMAAIGIIIGVFVGVPISVFATTHQGSWVDQIIRMLALSGYAFPAFWLGLVGLAPFYANPGWVAGPGRMDVYFEGLIEPVTVLRLVDSLLAGDTEVFWNAVNHIVLPAFILGFFALACIARMMCSFMLDQLSQESITTARVTGVPGWCVLWVHALTVHSGATDHGHRPVLRRPSGRQVSVAADACCAC